MSRPHCPKNVPAAAIATGGYQPECDSRERQQSGTQSFGRASLLRTYGRELQRALDRLEAWVIAYGIELPIHLQ
jgi:hypothetical protein